MTDFERRLRAAMAAAAEPPPAGLLDAIRRRHRRHLRRAAAASAAAIAAVAIAAPLTARAINDGAGPVRPSATSPAAPAGIPSAAPGTVLRDCQSSEGGTLGSDWKARSVHAGPVWFIYARPDRAVPAGQRPTAGKTTSSAMAIAVMNGRTAVIRATGAAGGRFRFLADPSNAGQPYTLTEGAPGLTLAGCPAGPIGTGIPESWAPGLTIFWEGYVTDLHGCIPLGVRAAPGRRPIRVTIAAAGRCPA
jgi:lipoprotein-anchoring transpeptidase ErfK/SrfK